MVDDAGVITCTGNGFSYKMDSSTGQLIRSESKSGGSKPANANLKLPRLLVSKVNSSG